MNTLFDRLYLIGNFACLEALYPFDRIVLVSWIHFFSLCSFNSCHMFSLRFMSAFGGVHHQFTPFYLNNTLALLDWCLGSLSCIKRWPLGYFWWIKGSSAIDISVYICENISFSFHQEKISTYFSIHDALKHQDLRSTAPARGHLLDV